MDRRDNHSSYSRPQSPAPGAPRRRGTDHADHAGPKRLPEIYYRRRRWAAIIIVAAIALPLIFLLTTRGSDNSAPVASTVTSTSTKAVIALDEPEKTSVPSVTITLEPSDESADQPAKEVDPTLPPENPANEQAPEVKKTCELADLMITASADKIFYNDKELPSFFMTVKNPTEADCSIDLTSDVLRFEVYQLANNSRMWADIDCNAPVGLGTQIFPAGKERKFEARWSRTTSTPESCANRQPVPAGAYYLHTVMGSNASQPFDFKLG
ncbi:hypothetical protein N7326_06040 [Corynebacterium sp. ES2794-CONJ1]|uniref:hypothetical protein n=1 Tax=unclassified Corynebacterium TaxID=2624378 RepID=UPI00216A3DE9|nr:MULTISPECIES: hypothetical protein [unclassified Corynebacterium]MCS4490265.1 hypothetical protein [Corynebacterium sp. ES2775-CONJ]MCS4491924.1 hypothetical protein [Corynebacterium sp. ES2715-CONJ3]MCS4532029.1 hypothetical protein [Corynebacterium sp. ES2730-CONJ]MCU9519430.1 hypothetical protein [Corynebacterium sp. ES2794-CONJ1]